MQPLRKLHRPTAWIALLAMLLWALMPTAGAARSAGNAEQMLVEVCAMGGTMLMQLPADSDQPAPSTAPRADCPLCCAYGGALPLPSTAAALPAAPGEAVGPPLLRIAPMPGLQRWQLSFARAPPSLS